VFPSSTFFGQQVERQKKVQQHNEVNNISYILCFKVHAVFSLNTAVASSGIIPALS